MAAPASRRAEAASPSDRMNDEGADRAARAHFGGNARSKSRLAIAAVFYNCTPHRWATVSAGGASGRSSG
jgi:hypothetical protein